MAENTTTTATPSRKPGMSRKTIKALGRNKRKLKLQNDKEFAGKFFEAKSKRSTEKKAGFRKKKKGKK